MMTHGENRREYNADDIRRYIAGDMSQAEMHAMEKAALDDPFLSDAIEGLSTAVEHSGSGKVEATRLQLQNKFEERVKKPRRNKAVIVGLKRWQAAAAAIIIITAGILGYLAWEDKTADIVLSQNESASPASSDSQQAKDTETKVDDEFAAQGATAADTATNLLSGGKQEAPIPTTSRPLNKAEEALSIAPDRSAQQTNTAKTRLHSTEAETIAGTNDALYNDRQVAGIERPDQPRAQATPASRYRANEKTAADAALASASIGDRSKTVSTTKRTGTELLADSIQQPQLPGVVPSLEGKVSGVAVTGNKKKQSKETDVHKFSGQVLTANDQPLSNAELRIVNTNQSFMTDENGRFSIPAADSVIEVDVTFIGHNTQRFKIDGNSTTNRLLLSPANAELSDVVVMGYGRSKRGSRNTIRLNNAEPSGGWDAFHNYIAASKNTSLSHTPPLETEITFKVTGNNKLSDFSILRSISPEHDAEAIRLVKTGPKWKVIKGRKAQVRVVIRL